VSWDGGQGRKVTLFKGANDSDGWGKKDKWWYSHTWWEGRNNVPWTVRAHEFGHQIGMYDEYPAGACDPARQYTNDPTCIMNAGTHFYARHVAEFYQWSKKVLMDKWLVLYNCDLPKGYVSCTIASEGYSTVYLTCNLGPRQEIGRYRFKVPPDACQQIRDQLRQTGYGGLPKPPPAEPSHGFVTVGEREGTAVPVLRGFMLTDLPPAIVPFMDAMAPMIEMVRGGPQQVLTGSAAWAPPSQARDAERVLHLTLGNSGAEPIEIQNPVAPEMEVQATLFISSNLPNADVESVELKMNNFRLLPKPGAQPPSRIPATLEILPGDSVVLEIRKRLLMSPGAYKAALVLHSVQGRINKARAVEGALSVEPGILIVTK
jgi:hypothetical protein